MSQRAVIGGMPTVPCGGGKQPLNDLLKRERHCHVDKSMFHFVAEMDTKELPITHCTKRLKSGETAKSLK